jgi:hypothetical protein
LDLALNFRFYNLLKRKVDVRKMSINNDKPCKICRRYFIPYEYREKLKQMEAGICLWLEQSNTQGRKFVPAINERSNNIGSLVTSKHTCSNFIKEGK